MPSKPKYGVKFVGYSADVIARKYGREVEYATLDFVTGRALVRANIGWVTVSNRADLGPFLRSLPNLARDLGELLHQRAAQAPEENAGTDTRSSMASLTCGQNDVSIAPDTDVNKFIRQITERFTEIEQVLEQAEQIGSRIRRRPYSEYIDEIAKTGICRVEVHGFALFVDERLIFNPNYQVLLARPTTAQADAFEIQLGNA
jgi:hypothetical protein